VSWPSTVSARMVLANRDVAAAEGKPLLWRELAKSVPGRSNKDCRRRWCNALNTGISKGPWSEAEDERLWNAVQKHGMRWAKVASEVGSRNSDQCSSHWSLTLNPNINYSHWTSDEVWKLCSLPASRL
jgi:Myb-like DNA-binding domain